MHCHTPDPLFPLVFHYLASSQSISSLSRRGSPAFLGLPCLILDATCPGPLGSPSDGPPASATPLSPTVCTWHLTAHPGFCLLPAVPGAVTVHLPGHFQVQGELRGRSGSLGHALSTDTGLRLLSLSSSIPRRANPYVASAGAWAPCPSAGDAEPRAQETAPGTAESHELR